MLVHPELEPKASKSGTFFVLYLAIAASWKCDTICLWYIFLSMNTCLALIGSLLYVTYAPHCNMYAYNNLTKKTIEEKNKETKCLLRSMWFVSHYNLNWVGHRLGFWIGSITVQHWLSFYSVFLFSSSTWLLVWHKINQSHISIQWFSHS